MKWLYACIIAGSISIFLLVHTHQQNVDEFLNSLPTDDKEQITLLFNDLFLTDNFAYTLFGDKPVSLSGDFIITPWSNTIIGMRQGGCFWKKWNIWKKYRKNLKIKNFLFLEELYSASNGEICWILFINKKSFEKTIRKHQKVFDTTLGRHVDPVKLLQELESGKISLQSAINHNEFLLGILLGYGQHNPNLYQRRNELEGHGIVNRLLNPMPEKFSSKEEEIYYIYSVLQSFGEYGYSPLVIKSIHFSADPSHPETIALNKKYTFSRGKISSIYANGDLLKTTLDNLIK